MHLYVLRVDGEGLSCPDPGIDLPMNILINHLPITAAYLIANILATQIYWFKKIDDIYILNTYFILIIKYLCSIVKLDT